ncbi:MAG: tRNA (adenosine(37)-N6)-threonylcarbamoyltransferase complex transferase subunit TsaD [Acidobacteria bacterium]|nr:tRNA (adenosine(37)-N6)-threonylcarbamoyltransferase complex transferase subunit TsaD [Acidobacteriota bacterium]
MDVNMLGIETSCDETAAAVVAETGDVSKPWTIRSSVIASQADIHREWGGVVPEIAARQHVRDICGVVERALQDGQVGWQDLGAIAVTQGPGLVGSLLVGVSFAKAVAFSLEIPLVAVHHLAGHIESLFLHNGTLALPATILVVSGGHTSLYHVPREGEYHLIGRTRDDAAGEAYDKVAKLLGLGYPGGPIIDKLAQQGNDRAVAFPIPRMTHPNRNVANRLETPPPFGRAFAGRTEFSFSGLKTAVMRHVRSRQTALAMAGATTVDSPESIRLADREIADICASFQRVVVEALLDRTFGAARWLGARSVGLAGGVSANSRLRADAMERGRALDLPVFLPSLSLSTDNAAMIAAAGLRRFRAGHRAGLDLNAEASLAL